MKRQISAQYGHTLQQATVAAISELEREMKFEFMLKSKMQFTFDYHGIQVPMTEATTAEELFAQVSETLAERARVYDRLPAAPDAFAREQGGKMGEALHEAVPSAIQCGQRWGNHSFEQNQVEQLRHVFEFNGIRVPFNPWQDGEVARIEREVETQLIAAKAPYPHAVCLPINKG
jgi:hypothetical protein